MEPQFWHERWQRADTGFHQKTGNDLLAKHWPALEARPGAQVLVPLCGKSLDMVWLAEHGHPVLGVELSDIAVDAFFRERSRAPGCETAGPFHVKRAGPYEIWCGDFFQLSPGHTRRIGALFDRASLVAMPRIMQGDYARQLGRLTPEGTPGLLISLDFDPSQMEGPPFPIPRREVETLFSGEFSVKLLEVRDGLEQSQNLKRRGLTALEESAYLLVRR